MEPASGSIRSHDDESAATRTTGEVIPKNRHIGTREQRSEQQEKAVERHAKCERVALLLGAMSREAEKNRRAADRIFNQDNPA